MTDTKLISTPQRGLAMTQTFLNQQEREKISGKMLYVVRKEILSRTVFKVKLLEGIYDKQ